MIQLNHYNDKSINVKTNTWRRKNKINLQNNVTNILS